MDNADHLNLATVLGVPAGTPSGRDVAPAPLGYGYLSATDPESELAWACSCGS